MKNLIGYIFYPSLYLTKNISGLTTIIFHHIDKNDFRNFKKLILRLDKLFGFIDPIDIDNYLTNHDKLKRKKILLTFDDGFKSNYIIAENILNPLGIKSIFFVNPNFIKLTQREEQINFIKNNLLINDIDFSNPDICPMNFTDITSLVDHGHIIGSHTMNHRRLSEVKSNNELKEEIISSKKILEKITKQNIQHFAFPFGDINSISKEALKIASREYKYVHSGIRGLNNKNVNKYTLRREPINLNYNIYYNLFVANNGISFKDRMLRNKLDSFIVDD